MTATTNCTDTIAPGDSAYDNSHAAEDIERLRTRGTCPRWRSGHRQRRAGRPRLRRVDTRTRWPGWSSTPRSRRRSTPNGAEEQQVKGEQAALDAFAAQCAAANCPLGPDPKGAVDSMLAAARAGRGPGGASVAAVADGDRTALAFPRGDRVGGNEQPRAALAAARSGDSKQLNNLINQAQSMRGDRRAVRQLVQRLAEPPDTRPGPRARGRVGQGVPAVRQGRGTRPGQVPELAQRHRPTGSEEPQGQRAADGWPERPGGRQRGRRRGVGDRASTPAWPASG